MPAPRYGAMVKRVFSLVGTSLFWGAGVTLRFLLVLWVPVALGITDNATPTYLNAMVAIGIVVGAGCGSEVSYAGNRVTLYASRDFDWRGGTDFFPATRAAASLCLVDADWRDGGLFLSFRSMRCYRSGVKKASGRGMRLQYKTLAKNSAMLLMLGIYSLAVMIGIPVVPIGIGFGALFALAITALWIWQRRH